MNENASGGSTMGLNTYQPYITEYPTEFQGVVEDSVVIEDHLGHK